MGLACVHCGEDCGKHPVMWDDKPFCCNGCVTVYQILNQNKLEKYYDIQPMSGIKVEQVEVGNKYAFIDNEDNIKVDIVSNFKIKGDLNYLSIALKNLIDNGLKYSTKKPVYIIIEENNIYIKSIANKLDKPLEYYCQLFTQGDNSRGENGYGLGLSLVKRILDKHHFKLSYYYDGKFNIFSIKI